MSDLRKTLQNWCVEVDDHFQDGHEHTIFFFPTKEAALKYINDRETDPSPSIISSYSLYEIIKVKHHPLSVEETEIAQPPVRKKQYVTKGKA